MYKGIYSKEEVRSLAFYQGSINLYNDDDALRQFYGTQKAYEIMNSLMYNGISNEKIRIINEGRQLNPNLFNNIEEILKVYTDIFSLMSKYSKRKEYDKKDDLITYRIERGYALPYLRNGYTVSFTSTSKQNDWHDYFRKKDGLLILQFNIPPNIPYIDINEVLGDRSIYQNQHEILLPPFLEMDMKPLKLSAEEKGYRDINQKAPIGKYKIEFSGNLVKSSISMQEESILREELVNGQNIKNAISVIESIKQMEEIQEQNLKEYLRWKRCFQKLVKFYFTNLCS